MYLKLNLIYYFFIILSWPILVLSNENEDIKSDILFLKIQELELEIAELRNKIETQNFLIEKLLRESLAESDDYDSDNLETLTSNADIRFDGIDDPKSKDQIYSAAILALEEQNFDKAFNLFTYFVESFVDDEKIPLSYFWLGEISFIKNDLENSKIFFLELISLNPSHYRVPLAHKKLGDIYLKTNDVESAKEKYNYVVREYPNNTASSLALQILKNME